MSAAQDNEAQKAERFYVYGCFVGLLLYTVIP